MKTNKNTRKIKVTENDFKLLDITTWQKMPDDNQNDTMTTKPEWFNEFENKQEQRWKEQQEFNQ